MKPLERYLFIEGGALAIENTLKAAMDWKVRKNMAAGRGERGTDILHFRHAFHGRSGYTMSLTNTDPRKTDLFAKFDWPRVSNPSIDFSLPETEREADVIAREKKSEEEIRKAIAERGPDICAIIIEPIQGEGGDNHFRGEWLKNAPRNLRRKRDASHFRRSANRFGHNWSHLVLPTFRRDTRSDGVWQKSAGLRRDGWPAPR